MGHELRNPLSGIKMSAQLLGKKLADLGSEGDESVQVILGEIERLEVVVEDLLTFAGPAKLDTQPGDVNEVVRGVLFFMKRQLDHADVMIDDELDDTVPEVPLDPQRLRQVVLNLVLNAVEAMPGGGTLTVRTEAADDVVEIALADTGRGIKPEDADTIFEPFFTTKKGGSGLGLAVSKLIVEAHGGALSYEPTSLGSRFVVSLPRRAAPANDESERTDAESEATASR
jgi:two-component system sensor histidine kinase HydH